MIQLEQLVDFPEQVLKIVLGLLALLLIIFCGRVGGKGFSLFFIHVQGEGMPGIGLQDMKGLLCGILDLEEILGKGLVGIVGENCSIVDNSIFFRVQPRGLIWVMALRVKAE